jgi:tetratricopeptide (TPR) repeat protein
MQKKEIQSIILDLMKEGKYQEAVKYCNMLAAAYSSDMDSADWYAKGRCHSNLEQHEEAVKSYARCLELDPGNYEAMSDRGISLLTLDRVAEAFGMFSQALSINADIRPVWLSIGRYFARKAGIDSETLALWDFNATQENDLLLKAVCAFKRLVAIDPSLANEMVELPDGNAVNVKFFAKKACAAENMTIEEILGTDHASAAEAADSAAKTVSMACCKCGKPVPVKKEGDAFIGPLCVAIPGVLCSACLEGSMAEISTPPALTCFDKLPLAMACEALKDVDFISNTIAGVRFFCDLFKGEPAIYAAGAIRLHIAGQADEAHKLLDRGMSECDNSDQLLVEKAALYGMSAQPLEGLKVLERVQDRSRNRYYTVRGDLLKSSGSGEEAAECWQQAMEYDKDNDALWKNLGRYYLAEKKDYKTAETHYADAVKVFPGCRAFYASLADSMFYQGRFEEALLQYKNALACKDDDNLQDAITGMIKKCEKEIGKRRWGIRGI